MSEKKTKKGLTRRDFIKGTATGAGAAALAGLSLREAIAIPLTEVPKRWDAKTDVVVVGAGCGGSKAALQAHEIGTEVIIIEKMPTAGGSACLSGGILYCGGGTSVQRAAGITDTAEEMYKYLIATSKGLSDPELVKTWANKSTHTIETLIRWGVEFPPEDLYVSGSEKLPEYAAITPPKARGHSAKGKGAGYFKALYDQIKRRGIELLLETPMRELVITAKREVVGVRAERNGKEFYIKARKAVVLATGGFGHNKIMVKSYLPKFKDATPVYASGCSGDGILAAQALGADLVFMASVEPGCPRYRKGPKVYDLPWVLVHPSGPIVVVNKEGKRFVDETLHYTYFTWSLMEQADSTAFIIFDEEVRKLGAKKTLMTPLSEDLSKEIKKGIVLTASTITELATKMGIKPAALEETMNTYNKNAEAGLDSEFGKKEFLSAVKTSPFYALEIFASLTETKGGIKINTKAQVIDVFGQRIPRLYAAASVAGGLVGAIYSSGSFLGSGSVFGLIAGDNAAREKAWE